MKTIVLLVCLELFVGCSSLQLINNSIIEPVILKQQPLPEVPKFASNLNFDLYTEMLINKEGSVESAKLLNGSGSKNWDSLIVLSFYDWKFSPATYNGKPIEILIRRLIRVEFTQIQFISLAEIVISNLKLADSLYYTLQNGTDFYDLAFKCSISSSREKKGILGRTSIQSYAKNIQNVISKLNYNEFTKPLPYGLNYIILKRLNDSELDYSL